MQNETAHRSGAVQLRLFRAAPRPRLDARRTHPQGRPSGRRAGAGDPASHCAARGSPQGELTAHSPPQTCRSDWPISSRPPAVDRSVNRRSSTRPPLRRGVSRPRRDRAAEFRPKLRTFRWRAGAQRLDRAGSASGQGRTSRSRGGTLRRSSSNGLKCAKPARVMPTSWISKPQIRSWKSIAPRGPSRDHDVARLHVAVEQMRRVRRVAARARRARAGRGSTASSSSDPYAARSSSSRCSARK